MRERSFREVIIFALFLLLVPNTVRSQNALAGQDNAQAAAQGAVRLHVLTWNVKGGSCKEKRSDDEFTPVVIELQHRTNIYNLDVIALQEVFSDQATRIRKAVGFRHMHFYPTIICDGNSVRGNAILSRYTFEEGSKSQKYFLFQHPEEFDSQHPQEGERRNIIGGSIRVKGRRVFLYSTHLTARPDPNRPGPRLSGFCHSNEDSCESNLFRAQQAGESVDFINEQRDDARPFRAILMGDFNAERNPHIDFTYNAYEQVTNSFRDAWAIWAKNEGIAIDSKRGYTNPSGPPDYDRRKKRIDYIFLRKSSGINVIKVAVLLQTKNASDHYPVLAILAFN